MEQSDPIAGNQLRLKQARPREHPQAARARLSPAAEPTRPGPGPNAANRPLGPRERAFGVPMAGLGVGTQSPVRLLSRGETAWPGGGGLAPMLPGRAKPLPSKRRFGTVLAAALRIAGIDRRKASLRVAGGCRGESVCRSVSSGTVVGAKWGFGSAKRRLWAGE